MNLAGIAEIVGYIALVAGAIWAVYTPISAFLSRRRISVRLLREYYELKDVPDANTRVDLQVINLGDNATTLSSVEMSALNEEGSPIHIDARILSDELHLPPHQPVTVAVVGNSSARYLFSWFRKYSVQVTRGTGAAVYKLNASETMLTAFQYWRGYILFRYFKHVPDT